MEEERDIISAYINASILLNVFALGSDELFIIGSSVYEFMKDFNELTILDDTIQNVLFRCGTLSFPTNTKLVDVYVDPYLDSKSIIIDGIITDLTTIEDFNLILN